MCSPVELDQIKLEFSKAAKDMLGDKLDAIILFGSYARGDYNEESDVDLMVRIRCDKEALFSHMDQLALIASRLSLKYDLTVSVTAVDSETYSKYKSALPFYQNVEREGILVA